MGDEVVLKLPTYFRTMLSRSRRENFILARSEGDWKPTVPLSVSSKWMIPAPSSSGCSMSWVFSSSRQLRSISALEKLAILHICFVYLFILSIVARVRSVILNLGVNHVLCQCSGSLDEVRSSQMTVLQKSSDV